MKLRLKKKWWNWDKALTLGLPMAMAAAQIGAVCYIWKTHKIKEPEKSKEVQEDRLIFIPTEYGPFPVWTKN